MNSDATGEKTKKLFNLAVKSISGDLTVTIKCHATTYVILPLPDD